MGLLTVLVGLLSCSPEPAEPTRTDLARQYFADNNAAARAGSAAQQAFFRRTQHPDFTGSTCELRGYTVDLEPALSTLRRDPNFAPTSAGPPRGNVWSVGVEVTTHRNGTVVGRQIGSQHLVFLDGRIYGFAPCPTG